MRLNVSPIIMTDDIGTECVFTTGSCVSCVTCFDETIEGEVIAFDYQKRLLILKCATSNGTGNDVHWINLDFVKDVNIKKEVKREDVIAAQMPPININKVEQRAKAAVDERKKLAEAVNSGVGQDGIRIYLNISKTLTGKVSWDGDNIVVMNTVKIHPPYKTDNIRSVSYHGSGSPPESVKYVKKMVEKYWNDQKVQSAPQKTPNSVASSDKPSLNNKG